MEATKRPRTEVEEVEQAVVEDEQDRIAMWLKPGTEKEHLRFVGGKIVWSDGTKNSPPNVLFVRNGETFLCAFHWNGNEDIM